MSKVKYRFNAKSLTYEKVRSTFKERALHFLGYLTIGLVFATVTIVFAQKFLPSPNEKRKIREIQALQLQYEVLQGKMGKMEQVLGDLQDRDDNIYRTIFETEPLPKS